MKGVSNNALNMYIWTPSALYLQLQILQYKQLKVGTWIESDPLIKLQQLLVARFSARGDLRTAFISVKTEKSSLEIYR